MASRSDSWTLLSSSLQKVIDLTLIARQDTEICNLFFFLGDSALLHTVQIFYGEHFKIVKMHSKCFTLLVKNIDQNISWDRQKPAT